MTIEIHDTEDFSSKLAHFFAAIQKLERAGIDTDPAYFESMVEDFLVQFEATTMMPAEPESAGYVVTTANTSVIPFDFKGVLYDSESLALQGIASFLANKPYGRVSDYRVVEATYFG